MSDDVCGYCGKPSVEVAGEFWNPDGTGHDCADEIRAERDLLRLQMDGLRKKIDRFDALARKYNYPGSHGPQELRDAFEELRG